MEQRKFSAKIKWFGIFAHVNEVSWRQKFTCTQSKRMAAKKRKHL